MSIFKRQSCWTKLSIYSLPIDGYRGTGLEYFWEATMMKWVWHHTCPFVQCYSDVADPLVAGGRRMKKTGWSLLLWWWRGRRRKMSDETWLLTDCLSVSFRIHRHHWSTVEMNKNDEGRPHSLTQCIHTYTNNTILSTVLFSFTVKIQRQNRSFKKLMICIKFNQQNVQKPNHWFSSIDTWRRSRKTIRNRCQCFDL